MSHYSDQNSQNDVNVVKLEDELVRTRPDNVDAFVNHHSLFVQVRGAQLDGAAFTGHRDGVIDPGVAAAAVDEDAAVFVVGSRLGGVIIAGVSCVVALFVAVFFGAVAADKDRHK